MNVTVSLDSLSKEALHALFDALTHSRNSADKAMRQVRLLQAKSVVIELEKREGWTLTSKRRTLEYFAKQINGEPPSSYHFTELEARALCTENRDYSLHSDSYSNEWFKVWSGSAAHYVERG